MSNLKMFKNPKKSSVDFVKVEGYYVQLERIHPRVPASTKIWWFTLFLIALYAALQKL